MDLRPDGWSLTPPERRDKSSGRNAGVTLPQTFLSVQGAQTAPGDTSAPLQSSQLRRDLREQSSSARRRRAFRSVRTSSTRMPLGGNALTSSVKCAQSRHESRARTPYARAEFREIHVLRRGEKFLERRLELRDRQMIENSAAAIVDQHDRQRAAQLRPQQKSVRVVQQREVAR